MKYIIKKIKLPEDLINIIYSFLDIFYGIKNLKKIWYKRLITPDFYYYPQKISFRKSLFKKEEAMLNILIKNKVFDMINAIHIRNLNDITSNKFYCVL